MHRAEPGDRVRVEYSRLVDQCAETGQPRKSKTCEFTVGGSEVFAALSLGVVGMVPGDRKRITLEPAEAYGTVQPKLVRTIPRGRFPKSLKLTVGKRLTAVHGLAGRRRRVTVVEITPDSVVVDGNHPLAGKVVVLEVNLLTLDSSADANSSKPQFDMGGEH
jgi:FKBP-type peptidyl-prolyl cis-trans isomerase 2